MKYLIKTSFFVIRAILAFSLPFISLYVFVNTYTDMSYELLVWGIISCILLGSILFGYVTEHWFVKKEEVLLENPEFNTFLIVLLLIGAIVLCLILSIFFGIVGAIVAICAIIVVGLGALLLKELGWWIFNEVNPLDRN